MSLIPATFLVTLGFFVLFAALTAQGAIKGFGQILAGWIFVLALFPLTAGAYFTWTGQCPVQQMIKQMHTSPPAQ